MTLCTICARGGSKGVPQKNTRLLLGRPLITHSIERAQETGLFEAIAVSSDSDEILEVAAKAGVTTLIKRPDRLATDQAAKLPVVQHCMLAAEESMGQTFSVVVDLDATSPLRSVQDIVAAHHLLLNTDAQNVITAMHARRSPYFNMIELDSEGYARLSKTPDTPVLSRQKAPGCFDMNASIYVWRRESLLQADSVFMDRTRMYLMPEERSIDIDTELDFRFVEFLLNDQPDAGRF